MSASSDGTIKEWDASTGERIKTHQKANNFAMSEYHPKNMIDTKLQTDANKIYLPASSRDKENRTLINIPGLWIQGCSFKNLEKNSQWSEEALELMKQYGARF